MRPMLLAATLAAFLAGSALADVVTLTNGSQREGRVVREDDKSVVLEVTQGRFKAELTFKREEVRSIERGQTAAERLQAEVDKRRGALKDADAAGWADFARWLDGLTGYSSDARAAWEKVLAADPDNAAARQKLGYQKLAGRWISETEIMAAKGLVPYRGVWVTPEDRKKAEEADRKVYEDIKIELVDDAEKAREKKFSDDTRKLAEWRRQMEALAAQRAAELGPEGVTIDSGGVVMGPYGYGYYGVRTYPGGAYVPFIPASGQVIQYTGVGMGGCPVIIDRSRSSSSSSGNFGVTYTSKHWNLHWGSR